MPAILVVYLLLGALFATQTPLWQVPDEPAHFHNIRAIAETGTLPVLEPGDYPAAYLEEIKARRFPPDMPVDAIAYEAHQPPLYYLLATPVYLMTRAASLRTSVIALRLFSLLLSAVGLYLGYRALRVAFPRPVWLPIGALAIAAALPMHVALSAGINNDALSELLINAGAWAALATRPTGWRPRRAAALGLLLGLALLTKMQSYVAVAIVLASLAHDTLSGALPRRRALGLVVLALGVAGLVAAPWVLRNMLVYGPTDPLALSRHDLVVEGQLTTTEWLVGTSVSGALLAFLRTTFQSFWGQFGWMAAPLDQRLYLGLGLFVALCAAGLVTARLLRAGAEDALPLLRSRAGTVLVVWFSVTSLGYLWWNVRFVQHQGRYLFPALMPIALALAAGWDALLRQAWRIGAALLGVAAAGVALGGALSGDVAAAAVLGLLIVAGGLAVLHWAQRRWAVLTALAPGAGLAALSLYSLFVVVVPHLSP